LDDSTQNKALTDGAGEVSGGAGRFGMPIDLYRVLLVLWQGRFWLVLAATLGLVAGVAYAKFGIANTYTALALLKYEGIERVEGMPAPSRGEVGSLVQTVRIPDVLRPVQERLQLPGSVGSLASAVNAVQDYQTNMIRIETFATTAEMAADLANTITDVFLDYHKNLQLERLREAITGIDGRIEAAQHRLDEARHAYDDFRESHGVADLTTEQRSGIDTAVDLRSQRDMIEAEIQALDARVQQLRRNLRSAPRMVVTSAAGASPEASERARLEVELATARSNLSQNHPRVQALEAQLAALNSRARSGSTSRVEASTLGISADYSNNQVALSTALADLESARERLRGINELATRADERLTEYTELEGQGVALMTDLRVAEQLMSELRDQRARLENATREPRSGFIVVAPATVPEAPTSGKKKYVAALGIPLAAVLIAVLGLIGRELRGLRVATPAEVAYWSRTPVVGMTTWPRDDAAVEQLIADLDDFAPNAQGDTLVVAGNAEATELARRFAAMLSSDWSETTLSPVESGAFRDSDPGGHRTFRETQETIVTPAPQAAAAAGSVALVRASSQSLALVPSEYQRVNAWEGEEQGQGIRRAARLSDRVLVVVSAGQATVKDLISMRLRLGRTKGVGCVLVGVDDKFRSVPDRIGPVDEFWSTRRA